MPQSQFSLSWSAHKSNICAGLSSLQQNGEFVDMTLAADGHHVKVHQIIMALSSPYIKDLIASAQCPHPVIFLNKISYGILSAILEYIYTGEVVVSVEHLTDLLAAGRELHIKGLEDMKLNQAAVTSHDNIEYERETTPSPKTDDRNDSLNDEYCYFEISNPKEEEKYVIYEDATSRECNLIQIEIEYEPIFSVLAQWTMGSGEDMRVDSIGEGLEDSTFEEAMQTEDEASKTITEEDTVIQQGNLNNQKITPRSKRSVSKKVDGDASVMQYTVSNQGSLQMILNRFIYYLKYTKRNGTRHWRCVEYLSHSRCPAQVVTNDDVVTQRISAHTHSFHDKKILKKVQDGAIFTAIKEAVREGNNKRKPKVVASSEPQECE